MQGISLASLASHLGIAEFEIAAIEQGKSLLQPDHLLTACELFGITIEEFMRSI
jgi:transcriptional regulator with XRE-family HTH domain